MSKKGYSIPGLFGTMNHYDSNGKKIGESRQGLFGIMNHYDNSGNKVGHSNPGMFGSYKHYDSDNKKLPVVIKVCGEVGTIMMINIIEKGRIAL